MSLQEGTLLGYYEISALIGAGGMGLVYRGRDTRLHRDVAIKVLPEAFASDQERVARFEREARALAALNHPHIAQIYGFEHVGDTRALVMELVEGERLADRIERGPLPLSEALAIARQIVDALDAAHEQGIVHRDLKPENIKLRSDGTAKVLDFGLAKAVGTSVDEYASTQTATEAALSHPGLAVGTAPYMAPEQLRGGRIDKRVDIWAFGCVLFEMLTGRRPFEGPSVTDVLGAIVRAEPDWQALPPSAPLAVRRLLRRCLQKDPRDRLRDIADAVPDLAETIEQPAAAERGSSARIRRLLPWVLVAALTATLPFSWVRSREGATPAAMRARFTIVPPGGMVLPYPPGRLAISPDGRQIVFAVKAGTTVRLVARDVTSGALTPVPESDGVTSIPFWSPDSQWIAFAAGTKLRRVSIATGAAQTICDLPAIVSSNPLLPTVASAASGTWNASGTILFSVGSALYGSKYPLFRVPATGGQAVALTTLDAAKQETEHAFPEFLPDGTLFLFLVRRGGAAATVVAGSLNDPAMRKPILDNDMRVSVAGNSIVYPRGGGSSGGDVLYAQSFDHRTLAVTGQPLAIATDIAGTTVIRSVSAAGDRALVFENRKAAEVTQFTWYDRRGKKLGTAGEPASYDPSFSMTRDGRRFAFIRDGDVWAFDVTHRTQVRLTTDPALDNDPVWSPDGSKVMFDSPRRGTFDVFVKTVGSAGPETVVLATDHPEFVEEWSPDGRYVVLVQHPENDLIALSLADRQTIRITQDTFRQDEPRFSPNGKWLAYSSDESGSPEIFVTAFPPMGTRHLVSAGTGVQPRWAADGRELYYLVPDGTIMSAHIDPSTAMPTSSAKPLFKTKLSFVTDIWDQYDVTNDGRFIVLEPIGPPEPGGITVITNWTAGRK